MKIKKIDTEFQFLIITVPVYKIRDKDTLGRVLGGCIIFILLYYYLFSNCIPRTQYYYIYQNWSEYKLYACLNVLKAIWSKTIIITSRSVASRDGPQVA